MASDYSVVAKAILLSPCENMPMRHPLQIKAQRKRHGFTQETLAEGLGVDQSTVTRWETGKRAPDVDDLQNIASLLGIHPGELFEVPNQVAIGPTLYVKGAVAAGVWREATEWPEDDWLSFTGRPDVTADLEHRFGLMVQGDSMNEIYPHGTIVECVSTMGRAEIVSGKRVVVLRERSDGDFESTVKELRIEPDGTQWLLPRSHNPAFQAPIRIGQAETGIVETRIIAVVVGSYRPE